MDSLFERSVQLVGSSSDREDLERTFPFSRFSDRPNIVLLGDPGAGKSFLFDAAATREQGQVLKVRSFLNAPEIDSNKSLFLDALDERRSGHTDHTTIDTVIQKLFQTKPRKVRIACRGQDWLDETDLGAFRQYFDQHGGFAVVRLLPLSEEEQHKIIKSKGISDADSFAAQAGTHSVGFLLLNPQTLTMLCDVVAAYGWPDSKTEVFDRSAELLLKEHNKVHAQTASGQFNANELKPLAGKACAVRLISDTAGIAIDPSLEGDDLPSVRSLSTEEPDKLMVALKRRAFASPSAGCVDYIHRTIAEFLAASWLAEKIRSGFPLARVTALISVDGEPAPELRGLHAWLATLLGTDAVPLINGDPYGVLTYGDPGNLSLANKKHLLTALADLSELDPWFRSPDWTLDSVANLCTPEMVDEFREILSSDSNFAIKSIVLESLALSEPLLDMQEDLFAVLANDEAAFVERRHALRALLKFPDAIQARLIDSVKTLPADKEDAIRLRVDAMIATYPDSFGDEDYCALLIDILKVKEDISIGFSWRLVDIVPDADIPKLLDLFFDTLGEHVKATHRRNASEVRHVIDELILRVLKSEEVTVIGSVLWRWLNKRYDIKEHYGSTSERLQAELRRHSSLLRDVLSSAIDELVIDDDRWRFHYHVQRYTLNTISDRDFVATVEQQLHCEQPGTEKYAFLYELALIHSFRSAPETLEQCLRLMKFGEETPALTEILDRHLSCPLEEWSVEDAKRQDAARKEKAQNKQDNRNNFAKDRASIEAGSENGWMGWLSSVYCARFSDVDEKLDPAERIAEVLGQDNMDAALNGLIACAHREDIPEFEDVVDKIFNEKVYYKWWLGIIVGLNELVRRGESLVSIPDNTIKVAIVVNAVRFLTSENNEASHLWYKHVYSERREIVFDAYFTLIRARLGTKPDHVGEIYHLFDTDTLTETQISMAHSLLQEFPNAPENELEILLKVLVRAEGQQERILALYSNIQDDSVEVGDSRQALWMVAAYFAAEDSAPITTLAALPVNYVWLLRSFLRTSHLMFKNHDAPVPLKKLKEIAELSASHFPNCDHPTGGWSGDQNPWDGAEFVKSLIGQISAIPLPEATAVLTDFQSNAAFDSYSDFVKHTLADHLKRRRQAEDFRPSWQDAVTALDNLTPVSPFDLKAFVTDHIEQLAKSISGANSDMYRSFWNEDSYGHFTQPKPENSGRDYLLTLMRSKTEPANVQVEPEGDFAADKRADIVANCGNWRIGIECKRSYHPDVWTAPEDQLDRFYLRDPKTGQVGIYVVFWYGGGWQGKIPLHPKTKRRPQSPGEMADMLQQQLSSALRHKISIIVIDVSGEV